MTAYKLGGKHAEMLYPSFMALSNILVTKLLTFMLHMTTNSSSIFQILESYIYMIK